MASGSFPVYVDYEEINGHKYWDGGILSNTPLRELIQLHRDYWYKKMGLKEVPNLEVYIVDLWPTKSMRGAPIDHDGVVDRLDELQYIDKTEYDQKTAVVVEDYVQIYNDVKEMVISSIQDQNAKKQMENRFNEVLKEGSEEQKAFRRYKNI
jgi:predicted acylesterase/phospholipase RssA